MRMFPILNDPVLQEIPWGLLSRGRDDDPILEKLADRGGLDIWESLAVIEGADFFVIRAMPRHDARNALTAHVSEFMKTANGTE